MKTITTYSNGQITLNDNEKVTRWVMNNVALKGSQLESNYRELKIQIRYGNVTVTSTTNITSEESFGVKFKGREFNVTVYYEGEKRVAFEMANKFITDEKKIEGSYRDALKLKVA